MSINKFELDKNMKPVSSDQVNKVPVANQEPSTKELKEFWEMMLGNLKHCLEHEPSDNEK